ncbi:capsid protein [Niallia sp. RD1]|uniref:capsid protein n=1 Tax=Niallia sp. RD1 TaxID=2962858 RepID=UPI0020C1B11E|nr:capsid protein [Niallia sp. RD1]UTI41116.1 capsid protein [Niallia sp. RD1]
MAAVNYATSYQQAVQQAYYGGLYFQAMYETPNNNVLKWINAKTIQIPSLTVGGFIDVDRDVAGTFSRRADNAWETKTLEHDRELPLYVDPMDVDETNQVLSIANITRVFNSEQKIPEMDKYFASKLYSEFVALGKTADTTVADTSNILKVFDTMMKQMDEAEVPKEGRILYATPDFEEKLKNAEQIQRTLEVRGTAKGDINRNLRSLDSVTIVSVPSSRMKTAYNFTSGAVPAVGADQINMILIHPTAVVTPQKYDYVGLSNPSPETHGKYYYYERKYWDVFILGKKVDGVKIHITDAGV